MTNIEFKTDVNNSKIKKCKNVKEHNTLNHRHNQSDYAGLVEWND